jgi:predicted ATPase
MGRGIDDSGPRPRPGESPAEPTRFFGRAKELEAIEQAFASGARLVVLVGAGGLGKTRLARRYVADAIAPGPAWLCDLGEARTLDGLCAVVGRVLHVPLGEQLDGAVDRLGRALRALGPARVVLDELDHLVPIAEQSLASWLATAPEARFLATSRERLHVPGCVTIDVEPLGRDDAIDLFFDRAHAAGPLARDARTTAATAAIVDALEGIPLAIELCAARTSLLEPEELLGQIARRFELLSLARASERRDVTLASAIDASWDALEPWARRALAQCAVFRGGFGLAAAEAVLACEPHGVLDALQVLVDKSLLRTFTLPDFPGERRFGLFEAIRERVLERAAGDPQLAEATARHAACYLALGARWAAVDARARLALERDNLEAVHARAMAAGDAQGALAALLALRPLYDARGPMARLLEQLEAALALATRATKPPEPALLARAQLAKGVGEKRLGRYADAVPPLEAAVTLSSAQAGAGDEARATEALAQAELAIALLAVGRREEAHAHRARADALVEGVRDPGVRGEAAMRRFLFHAHLGEVAKGLVSAEAAIDLFHEAGRAADEAYARLTVGLAHAERSLPTAQTRRRLEEAAEALRAIGERRLEAWAHHGLASLEQEAGRLDVARVSAARCLSLAREVSDLACERVALGALGDLALEAGDAEEARARYREASRLSTRDPRAGAVLQVGEGAALAMLGRLDDAEACFQAAHAIFDASPRKHDGLLVRLRETPLRLARAREASARGGIDDARAHVAAVRAALAEFDAIGAPAGDELRFATRLARAALAVDEARRALEAAQDVGDDALVIGDDAAWFRMPGGERSELETRKILRKLLLLLADARLREPGVAVRLRALVACGWPGESMREKAALARVRVAMSTLRKLGLGERLQQHGDGYRLDPTLVVRVLPPT